MVISDIDLCQGHFARECRIKETQDNRRRDAWNSGNKDGSRTRQKDDSKALVTIDGEGVDWTNYSEDEDYALMACNSSDSDTEREQLSDASIDIKAYSQGLKKVEAQLVAHQQGQLCKGMHAVTPTYEKRNYMPSGPDVEIDDSKFTYGPKQTQPSESESQSRHKTGTRPTLLNFKDFKVGPVAFWSFNLENIVPSGGLACLIAKATTDESNKWHRRLGHVNFKNLNKLVKGNLVRGLPSKLFQNDHTCVACQKGKQHKASCKAKTVSSISHSLQLLHMDLFGPTSVRSLNHKTYCLVITDDFSRFSWVFFLRTKDETSGILKDFIRQIENQLNQKVKTIRCDNGTEFKNRDVIEFCGSKGIKREYSNARTPQQNGVAERKNRTLIEAARTMLADSFLPNTFWAEAVSTACYVLNRVLVTKPHNKTPYELITGKILTISYIRPFGCYVTILNTIDHLGKFAGKSDEGFLVGYSLQSKAFGLYNLETKRVEENLHITFLENKPNVAGKANLHAGQQEANQNAGTEEIINAGDSDKEDESAQDYFVLPIWPSYSSIITPALTINDKREGPREEEQVFIDDLERLKRQEQEANEEAEVIRKKFEHLVIKERAAKPSSTNIFSTVSTPAKASSTNLLNTVSILGSKLSSTNKKAKSIHAFVSYVQKQKRTNHKDFHHCLFACFLSQHEPKKISEALEDESWVDAMQEELLQFEIQKVWVLVDLPYGKKAIVPSSMGKLMKELSVYSPPGFQDPKYPKKVYKVVKALYGLHQAPRAWYLKGKPKLGLWYPRVSLFDLESYSDSDYAGANLDRKSTTGGLIAAAKLMWASFVDSDQIELKEGRESLRRVTDGTAALLLLRLFILWWTNEVPYEPQTDSSPAHTSEVPIEHQPDPSPRPSPTTTIPDSIPESFGENLGGHSSSDKSLSGNEGDMTIQGESSVQRDPLLMKFLKIQLIHIGHRGMLSSEGRKGTNSSTMGSKVSTDKHIEGTDEQVEGTEEHNEGTEEIFGGAEEQREGTEEIFEGTEEQREGTEEKVESTDEQIQDVETIAYVLLNRVSKSGMVSKEKEKGVELKDVEETDRPRPTSTRSLLTLKPLPKIDPKDKGKKKIEEEDESESESDGIPQAEKKFKQLENDEELARKVQEEWEAEVERNRIAEENAANFLGKIL
ncbi:putative ribonuclease H-like domain-containing protein [Tanacetum coccineum]